MNNMDIGVNISDDLDQLRRNLNKLKKSNLGEELADIEIEKLDWMEDNKKMKAFIIYETSLWKQDTTSGTWNYEHIIYIIL